MQELNLTQNQNFYGFELPKYYLAIIEIIVLLIIIFVSHDEIPVMVFLIFIWFVGILAIEFLPLVVITMLIYVAYNYVHIHKKK